MLVHLPYKVLPVTVSHDKFSKLKNYLSDSGICNQQSLLIECDKNDEFVMKILNEIVSLVVSSSDKADCSHLRFKCE